MFDRDAQCWSHARFRDYYPAPPYSHLFARPEDLVFSPYEPFVTALAQLPDQLTGFYQAVFQPVHHLHNWHRNVEVLYDFEYGLKLWNGEVHPQRYAQQAPSGDLLVMAGEVEKKAHYAKPFFALALRLAVLCESEDPAPHLQSLSTFCNMFQQGGRPLEYLTEEDYSFLQTPDRLREMFLLALTYRSGCLVNSRELAGPVHIPPGSVFALRRLPLQTLETLPRRDDQLLIGTPIGTSDYAGSQTPVCIPPEARARHTHLVGATDMGKSTLMKHMILDDIKKGAGVAVIDPHGDLVQDMLRLLPDNAVSRTIFFNPGDPNWIPLWNPLALLPGQDKARLADEIVGGIRKIVTGWGDRLAHILRNTFYSLLHLPHPTLLDAWNLLMPKSPETGRLIESILRVVENPTVQQFLRHDIQKYRQDEISPAKHKLSKLLGTDSIQLMLSQSESAFGFRQIMDEGMIFFADLSALGSEVREVLGSFLLTLMHQTALSRADVSPEERKQFHIYCDEAHRVTTDAIEDMINETRKYGVGLTLAHQQLSQFSQEQVDALANVGSLIIFRANSKDAQKLTNGLRESVKPEQITSLEQGEAIARIGSAVVKIKTLGRLVPAANNNCATGHKLRRSSNPSVPCRCQLPAWTFCSSSRAWDCRYLTAPWFKRGQPGPPPWREHWCRKTPRIWLRS